MLAPRTFPLQGGLKRQPYGILKDLHGVLRPGTTTLLLGPPGAGKTVFLQVPRMQQGGSPCRLAAATSCGGLEKRMGGLPAAAPLNCLPGCLLVWFAGLERQAEVGQAPTGELAGRGGDLSKASRLHVRRVCLRRPRATLLRR